MDKDLLEVARRFDALLDYEFRASFLCDPSALGAAVMASVKRERERELDGDLDERRRAADARFAGLCAGRSLAKRLNWLDQWKADCEFDAGARRRWRQTFGPR